MAFWFFACVRHCTKGFSAGPTSKKQEKRFALEAKIYHKAMINKFRELNRDHAMTRQKWEEWLPLFAAAEEFFAAIHPQAEFPHPSAYIVEKLKIG